MNPEQLKEHNKTTLVNNILKEMPVEQLPISVDNKENIKNYINYLVVKDYLLLNNDNVVLGKGNSTLFKLKSAQERTFSLTT